MTTIAIPKMTRRVENLLADPSVNRRSNDYRAYGRTLPGRPAPLFGQQYVLDVREARKLVASIQAKYTPATQKKVVMELFARAGLIQNRVGTVRLSEAAATELNRLSRRLGIDNVVHFSFNQPRPIHPVG